MVDLQAALPDNAMKGAPAPGRKFSIGDALPGVTGRPEMAFFDAAYGVDGYAGPDQAARVAAPNRKESLDRAGRAPLVDSPAAGIAFNDELPETVASKLKPEQLALWEQVATDPKSTPEQLTSLMKGFGYDLANADAIVAARDKGLGVNRNINYRLRENPRNSDGATGAAARGVADPVNLLDEAGAVVDTLGVTGGRENIWNSDRPVLDVLNRNIDQNRSILQADERDHFEARFGGQLASGLLIPVGGGARTAAQFAKYGAAEGAVAGFGAGEGSPLARLPNAAAGAALGGVGGYSLGKVAEGASPYITRGLLRRGWDSDVEARMPGGARAGAPERFPYATERTTVVGSETRGARDISQSTTRRKPGNPQTTISDGRPPDPKISQTAPPFNPAQKRQAVDMGLGPFGPVHPNLSDDWAAAVRRLSEDKDGEVPGALFHPEVGHISLVWGKEGTGHSDGYGLAKLLRYHANVVPELPRLIGEMEVTSRSQNRVSLASPTHQAGVRLDWDGKQKTWLITAFERLRGAPPSPDD